MRNNHHQVMTFLYAMGLLCLLIGVVVGISGAGRMDDGRSGLLVLGGVFLASGLGLLAYRSYLHYRYEVETVQGPKAGGRKGHKTDIRIVSPARAWFFALGASAVLNLVLLALVIGTAGRTAPAPESPIETELRLEAPDDGAWMETLWFPAWEVDYGDTFMHMVNRRFFFGPKLIGPSLAYLDDLAAQVLGVDRPLDLRVVCPMDADAPEDEQYAGALDRAVGVAAHLLRVGIPGNTLRIGAGPAETNGARVLAVTLEHPASPRMRPYDVEALPRRDEWMKAFLFPGSKRIIADDRLVLSFPRKVFGEDARLTEPGSLYMNQLAALILSGERPLDLELLIPEMPSLVDPEPFIAAMDETAAAALHLARQGVPPERLVLRSTILPAIGGRGERDLQVSVGRAVAVPGTPMELASAAEPSAVAAVITQVVERIVEIEVPAAASQVVERVVEVPVEQVRTVEVERLVEVPVELIQTVEVERLVEVPVELIRTVEVERLLGDVSPGIQTVEVERVVEVPVERVQTVEVERLVDVPVELVRTVEVERLVEVPVELVQTVEVERLVEVPVELVRTVEVERLVEVPVEQVVEVVREVEPSFDDAFLLDKLAELAGARPGTETGLRDSLAVVGLCLVDPDCPLAASDFAWLDDDDRNMVTAYRELFSRLGAGEGIARPELLNELIRKLAGQTASALPPVPSAPALAVSRSELCLSVRGFGDFDVLERDAIRRSQTPAVLLYTELEGFASVQQPDGAYAVRLAQGWSIHPADDPDGPPLWQEGPATVEDRSWSERNDFYLVQMVQLPESLAPGSYVLRVSTEDLASGESSGTSVPFRLRR